MITDDEVRKLEREFWEEYVYERMSRGMYQKDVSRLCGIARETISEIELSKHSPTLRVLMKLVWSLGCKLEIVPDEDNPNFRPRR
jgi:transcriptional regulator with XRE-family HTH domain